ncbi:MAG TPA: ubiquitin-like protein [bacterium]|nr:ubiquitin-like protein [bacterium]HPN44241.1 ubiquitin-like protein [bacterium]
MKLLLRKNFLVAFIFILIMATCLYAMQIYVYDHSFSPGSTYTYDVEQTDTIDQLKAKIEDLQSIPVNQQYLYFNGVFLEESYTLQDYNVQKNNTLDLYNYDTALPVSLTEFIAISNGNSVLIQWVTESETDNLGFILDKSIAETNDWQLVASWTTHSALAGQGSTSSRTEYSFTDVNVKENTGYRYRLASVSINGTIQIEKETEYAGRTAGLPIAFTLEPPYPNPFNSSVKIIYHLNADETVRIDVHDIMGRLVKVLLQDGRQQAGSYTLTWDGTDNSGVTAPSGEYIIRITTDNRQLTGKVLLLK